MHMVNVNYAEDCIFTVLGMVDQKLLESLAREHR